MTSASEATGRTALYRLYDADDQLLYVGISLNPASRWTQHANDKPWWQDIARTGVEWLQSREEALDAEMRAIKTEKPQHNVAHAKPAPLADLTSNGPKDGDVPEVSPAEAANLLGYNAETVRRMIREKRIEGRYKKLPWLKSGRWLVPRSEVTRLLAEAASDSSSTEEETRG